MVHYSTISALTARVLNSFMLLTRQSVHVDPLGGQADAHVPANKRREITKL